MKPTTAPGDQGPTTGAKKPPADGAPRARRHVRFGRALGRGVRRIARTIGWTVLLVGLLTLGMTVYGIAKTPVIGAVSGPP
jgi:hypothetical protein